MREAHHPSHDVAFATQNGLVLHAKDVADLAGASAHTAHADPAQHADGHFVVDDAHLLFSGTFSKSGNDLVVSGDGREVTVHDYFRGEVRAPLYAPDGSSLSGQVVTALAGHSSYAQAGDPAPAADTAIGQVAKLTGTATAIRNGVAVELHIGDKVYKGDVLEAGAESALGITFVDGTAFSLGSHARMVLNEMVYDPNGSSNSSFLSLVQGSITFVAGQTAKNGSMKIDTPVATMGIRGTAVFVDISANDGPTKFSVLVEPGNHVGSYELFNKVTGDKIGEVSTAGIQILITPTGFNQLSISEQAKTLADLQAEQALIQQVFSMAFEKVNDANPKFNFGSIGSGVSPFGGEYFYPFNPQSPPTIKLTSLGSGSDDNKVLTVTLSIPADPPPIVKVTNVSTVQAGGVSDVTVTQSSTPGTKTFSIGDQVKIIDPSVGVPPFFDVAVNYVKGTAVLLSAVGPTTLSTPAGTAVPGNFLTSLISIDTTTGVVSYDPSKFQFLGQGETAVYTIQFDSYGGPSGHDEANNAPYTVVETITLTVLGLNDPPVFSGSGSYQYSSSYATALGGSSAPQALGMGTAASTPVVTAALTERSDVSGASALDTATIQLPFTDQDFSDVAKNYSVKLLQVSASGVTTGLPQDQTALATELSSFLSYQGLTKGLNSINGNITEAFSAPDKTFDYLAAGEQLTISYTIQVTDPHGAISTEVLNIVVTGTNDVPVIQSSQVKDPGPLQAPVQSEGGWVVASNTYTFTDPDLSDSHATNAVFDAADSNLHGLSAPIGTIATNLITDSKGGVIGEFGWTLTLSAADLAELYNPKLIPPGTTIVESFDVSVSDHHGGTATKVVTIDIPTVDEWTGAGDGGLWSDPANWTAGVPGPISNVEIAPSTATQVAISSSDTIFGLNTNGNATLDITAGTLTIAGPVTNTIAGPVTDSGIIAVESNLTVDGATITDTGGDAGLTVGSGDTLTLQDGAVVSGGTLTNAGTVDVEKTAGAALDGVTVTNTGGTIQVDEATSVSTVPLLLDDGTTITNGTLSIGGVGVVDVEAGGNGLGATLDGVTVNGTASGVDIPGSLIEVGLTSKATLTLDDGTTITDGSLTIGATGVLDVEAGTTGPGATLNDVAVDATAAGSLIEVGATATLTLEGGTGITGPGGTTATITNAGTIEVAGAATLTNDAVGNTGTIQVDGTQTLKLSGTTIEGGTINDYSVSGGIIAGDIDVVGWSTIDGNATLNNGNVTVESSQKLTLDNVTVNGTAFTDTASGATLAVDATHTLTLQNGAKVSGGTLVNAGTVYVESSSGATLDGVAVSNAGSTVQVDVTGSTVPLLLDDGTAITKGILSIGGVGVVDVEAGGNGLGATLDGVTVNGSAPGLDVPGSLIDVGLTSAATLTLDDGTTIANGLMTIGENGVLAVENGGARITGADATLDGVAVTNNGTILVGKAGVTADPSLQLNDGTSIAGGTLTVGATGVLDVEAGAKGPGATLDDVAVDAAAGSLIKVDATATLTLKGGTDITGPGGTTANITNAGTIEVAGAATLTNDVVSNTGTIQVDDDQTLKLSGTTLEGGTINDSSPSGTGGTIEVVATSAVNGNATLNNGAVTVDANQTLKLDDVTVNGTAFTDTASGAMLAIDAGDTLTVGSGGMAVTGGTIAVTGAELDVNGGQTLMLQGGVDVVGGGTGTLLGKGPGATVQIETVAGATLDGVKVENIAVVVDNGLDPITIPLILDDGTQISGGSLTIGGSGEVEIGIGGATVENLTIDNDSNLPAGLVIGAGDKLVLSGVTVDGTIDDGTGTTVATAGTIEIAGFSIISGATLNNGGVTVDAGQRLTLDNVTVNGTSFTDTASGATLKVDGGDKLTLNGATITGGTVNDGTGTTVATAGTIEIATSSKISSATLNNGGVTVDANQTLTLDNVTVNGTAITLTASGAALAIDSGDILTLQNGASVTGGTIVNTGTLDFESSTGAVLTGVSVVNTGAHLQIDFELPWPAPATPLILQGGTSITGGELDVGSTSGELEIRSAAGASLIGVNVINAGPYGIQIDGGSILKLNGGDVTGGTIDDGTIFKAGTIEIVHSAGIGAADLNYGNVTVDAYQTLTLDNDTVTGTTFADTASGATLAVDSGDTLTLQGGAAVSGGRLINAGTLDIESWSGASLNGVAVTNTGGTIQVDNEWPWPLPAEPLVLAGGTTITGGKLEIGSTNGEVVVETPAGATLIDVAVTNGGPYGIQVAGDSILTLDDSSVTGGTVTNDGAMSVDGGKTLTLSGVTITGGTINDGTGASVGTIVIAGSTTISGASLNHGGMTVDAGTALTLDNDHVTGTTFTDTASGATLQVDGGKTLTLSGATIIGGAVDDGASGRAGTIEIAGSSTLEGSSPASPLSLAYGAVTVDHGKTLTLDNVTTTTTTIANNGTIDVHAGSVKLGAAVSGTGTIDVDVGTKLEFGSSVSSGQTIDFTGAKGTTAEIVLDQAQSFHATIAGFTGLTQSTSDQIDLANINFNSEDFTEHYSATTELLTVSDGSHTAQIQFVGFSGSLHFVSDGHNGTLIYDPPAAPSQDDQGSGPIVVAGNDVFMFGAGSDPKSSPDLGQLPRTSWHDYFNPPADGGVGDGGHWAAAGDLHHGAGLLPATDPGYIDALLQKNGGHLAANDFILHPGAHPA